MLINLKVTIDFWLKTSTKVGTAVPIAGYFPVTKVHNNYKGSILIPKVSICIRMCE